MRQFSADALSDMRRRHTTARLRTRRQPVAAEPYGQPVPPTRMRTPLLSVTPPSSGPAANCAA